MAFLQVSKQTHSKKAESQHARLAALRSIATVQLSQCEFFKDSLLLVQVPNAMMVIMLLLIQLQAGVGFQVLPGKVHLTR